MASTVGSTAFFPCPTCSPCHQSFSSQVATAVRSDTLPVPAVSLIAFSLKQEYNNLLKFFISKQMKTSKATPMNNQSQAFSLQQWTLYFDTRCLTLLVFQFSTLLRKSLLEAAHTSSSLNCRKHSGQF